MSVSDLLKMSLSSLWRRKLSTVLTELGVVVGTASIMVMISLGPVSYTHLAGKVDV